MPGMSVNIFSLQRIRKKRACSFTFKGVPKLGHIIPIYNKVGVHIATMQKSFGARPTLICGCNLGLKSLGERGFRWSCCTRDLGTPLSGGWRGW